jgi:hypothetical protein
MVKISNKTKTVSSLVIILFITMSCGLVKDVKELYKELSGEEEQKHERLLKEGVSADGQIMKVEDTNVTINKNPKVRMYIHVEPKDGEAFDAVVEMVVSRINVPRIGDTVTVWYNPKDKTDITME